jgi:hypothetical protein
LSFRGALAGVARASHGAAAGVVDREVADDPAEPGAELLRFLQVADALPRAEERFLCHVSRAAGVSRNGERDGQGDAFVGADECRERRRVTAPRPADEVLLRRVAHDHHATPLPDRRAGRRRPR